MKLSQGDSIETTITRIGQEGDGVGAYNGLSVIVPKTAVGDKVSCVIKYAVKKRIHADLAQVIESGSSRVEPPCVHYETCGGCDLQHINAEEYKSYKLGLLTNALKYANIPFPEIDWVSVGEKSRRRAFVRFDSAGCIGFYAHQSHNVVSIENCLILEPEIQVLLPTLLEISKKLPINIEGWSITNTDNGIDLILQSTENHCDSSIINKLSEFAKQQNIQRLTWKCGKKSVNALTKEIPFLTICGKKILLPQEYFLQASSAGQDAILNAIIPNVDNGAKVLDLFSGLGTYSFAVAEKAANVGAYEISTEMVKSMERNIVVNGLASRIRAYCRDMEKAPLSADELRKYDAVIINPPRTGALAQITRLGATKIAKIIIVSCNSSTFTRDAKILHEQGYKLKSLSAVDQFYYSHHLEQIGVFEF